MRATKHNIIIKPRDKYQTLDSGLIIPSKAEENPLGTVISAGGGTDKRPMYIKDGDTVVYKSNVGVEFEYRGDKLLVLKESHVIAVK